MGRINSVGIGNEKGRKPRRGGAKRRTKRSDAFHAFALGQKAGQQVRIPIADFFLSICR
jgi:hypothetical protein